MERQKQQEQSSGKCGTFLAIGMAVALIWGLILVVAAIYIRVKSGALLQSLMGNIDSAVNVKAIVSEGGQKLIPYTDSVADEIDVGEWPINAMLALLTAGILTIIFACLGIYGGLYESKTALYITLILLAITVITIIVMLVVSADKDSGLHTDARAQLVKDVQDSYKIEATDDMFILTMNAVMLWFECCGITGPSDFHNLTFTEVNLGAMKSMLTFQVAPACCKRELFAADGTGVSPYSKVRDCAVKGMDMMPQINNRSCYDAILSTISGVVLGVLILVLIWDLILFILTILAIIEAVPEEELGASFRKSSRKEDMEVIMPTKKFVPFAKISSAVTTDLNRIKSTEIW